MTAATNTRNRWANARSRRRAGRKTTQIGASATITWGYESSDRLQYLRSGSLTRFTYSYDNNSNLKTVEDLIGSRSTYLYDAKNRLTQDATSGTNAHTYDYSYDSRDNRTYSGEEGQWQFAYDAANRLVTAVNAGEDPEPVRTFTYDDNGNTTRIEDSIAGTTTMAYDCENRLSALQTASSLATYLYDGDGRKRVEIGASGRTTLVWDGWDYLQSYSGSKPLNYHTVDGLILAQRFDEEYAEYLPDFLGTVAAYADESGSPLAEARYKPYGLPLWSDGPVEDYAFGWVGQWGYRQAASSALAYVRNNSVHRDLAVWSARDFVWPSIPPYLYVLGRPVTLRDPYGLDPVEDYFNNLFPPNEVPPLPLVPPSRDEGLTSANCASIHIPVKLGPWEVTLNLQYCKSCYNCCNHLTTCEYYSIGVCAGASLDLLEYIKKAKDIAEDAKIIYVYIQAMIVDSPAIGGIGASEPTCRNVDRCPESDGPRFRVCANACASFWSLSACATFGNGFQIIGDLDTATGFCGFPSIEVCFDFVYRRCSP